MPIRTVRGELQAECSGCGEILTANELDLDDPTSFVEMLNAIKGDNWRIRKEGSGWAHTCPDCQ